VYWLLLIAPRRPVIGNVNWTKPHVKGDTVTQYHVKRYPALGGVVIELAESPVAAPTTTVIDHEELPDGVKFTYRSIADFPGSTSSGPSPVTPSSTITAINEPPVANADNYSVNTNKVLAVPAPGVLSNDTDADSASFIAIPVKLPSHGKLVLNANGSFTYTPNAGFKGQDTFTYQASNGLWRGGPTPMNSKLNAPATVTITVGNGH